MIGLEDAERIALDFVNKKKPQGGSTVAESCFAMAWNNVNTVKSARRVGNGWSVIVERVEFVGTYDPSVGQEQYYDRFYWRVEIDDEGNILEYDVTGPHTEKKIWQKVRPIDINIRSYRRKKDEDEDEDEDEY